MEVRLDDVADLQVGFTGCIEIDVDVPPGIDDRRHPGRLVRDERTQVPEALDRELLETHEPRLHRGTGRSARSDQEPR